MEQFKRIKITDNKDLLFNFKKNYAYVIENKKNESYLNMIRIYNDESSKNSNLNLAKKIAYNLESNGLVDVISILEKAKTEKVDPSNWMVLDLKRLIKHTFCIREKIKSLPTNLQQQLMKATFNKIENKNDLFIATSFNNNYINKIADSFNLIVDPEKNNAYFSRKKIGCKINIDYWRFGGYNVFLTSENVEKFWIDNIAFYKTNYNNKTTYATAIYTIIINGERYYKYDDRIAYCRTCGNAYLKDENNTAFCCEKCKNDYKKKIKNYSYKPEPEFKGIDEDNLYFGIEVETEVDEDDDKQEIYNEALDVNDVVNNLVYLKEDGSLNNGVEIVSHPFSYSWLMDHKNDLKEFTEFLIDKGVLSHDTDTCGFHIHCSRNAINENNLINIARIINENQRTYNELCRREPDDQYYSDSGLYDLAYEMDVDDYTYNYDRYQIINTQNKNTIEFRQPRGSLNINTIIATIQLHKLLIEMSKNYKTDLIDCINYSDYFELKEYAKNRGVL